MRNFPGGWAVTNEGGKVSAYTEVYWEPDVPASRRSKVDCEWTRANGSNAELRFHLGSEQRMRILSNNGLETGSGQAVLLERDERCTPEL